MYVHECIDASRAMGTPCSHGCGCAPCPSAPLPLPTPRPLRSAGDELVVTAPPSPFLLLICLADARSPIHQDIAHSRSEIMLCSLEYVMLATQPCDCGCRCAYALSRAGGGKAHPCELLLCCAVRGECGRLLWARATSSRVTLACILHSCVMCQELVWRWRV
jgi:hypothetical protein